MAKEAFKVPHVQGAVRGQFVTKYDEIETQDFKILPGKYGKKEGSKGAFFIIEGKMGEKNIRVMITPSDVNEWLEKDFKGLKLIKNEVVFDEMKIKLGWDGTEWVQ